MRYLLVACVAAAALSFGCGGAVDPYTGVDASAFPGESAVKEAYMNAQAMISGRRGNYREPYLKAFDGLKTAQERWLKEARPGGPQGDHLQRWRAKYRALARQVHGTCPSGSEKSRMLSLDLDAASRGVEPLLDETIYQLKSRGAGAPKP
jgi:hypothetical protein